MSVKITGDTIIKNKKYFILMSNRDTKYHKGDIANISFIRYDTSTFFCYSEYDSIDMVFYKLNANLYEAWPSANHNIVRYSKTGKDTFLGTSYSWKSYFLGNLISFEIILSDKFGPIQFHFYGEPPGTAEEYKDLTGCILDGKVYGRLLGITKPCQTYNKYILYQNYPNPFNPSTEIRYFLPQKSHVSLTIIDILWRRVKTLVNEVKIIGDYIIRWDGTIDLGKRAPSGTYFYQLKTDNFIKTNKMILIY